MKAEITFLSIYYFLTMNWSSKLSSRTILNYCKCIDFQMLTPNLLHAAVHRIQQEGAHIESIPHAIDLLKVQIDWQNLDPNVLRNESHTLSTIERIKDNCSKSCFQMLLKVIFWCSFKYTNLKWPTPVKVAGKLFFSKLKCFFFHRRPFKNCVVCRVTLASLKWFTSSRVSPTRTSWTTTCVARP